MAFEPETTETPETLELTSITEGDVLLSTAAVDALIAELKKREGGMLAVVDSHHEALCKAISGCNLNNRGLSQIAVALEDAGYDHDCDCDECEDCDCDELPAELQGVDGSELVRLAQRAYLAGVETLPEDARALVLILNNRTG